jgi:hypothetical protein
VSNQSDDTDIEELSKIEKIIRFLSLSLLVGLFLLRLLQQGRNLLLLPSPIFIYLLAYSQPVIKSYPRFYKPARFLLAILCLLLISNNFMFAVFEFILNIEFVKVDNIKGLNHPIANILRRWEFIIWGISIIILPFKTGIEITGDDD